MGGQAQIRTGQGFRRTPRCILPQALIFRHVLTLILVLTQIYLIFFHKYKAALFIRFAYSFYTDLAGYFGTGFLNQNFVQLLRTSREKLPLAVTSGWLYF